ncbi:ribosome biogenesis GTPase Der [Candidatus Contubernalis alkaliaceticus]|uniref:ribosome biogenesis GTPase Der n=1 Tax=Candidatus Contubernalis alkaliaceticus TaxID=338645 RepID=UPI001F4C218F|nr:ribosome biogenesis GTPase Der [Candidatus Contubernalis alkalaceticus]UNC92472.1 ribosome biogenesis GTPase Der [Candidatus Contubernalis alkalaceticus]
MDPLVAIVGRPNVGKSTLFNRLAQTRSAIVEEQSGVTRDRLYSRAYWNSREFVLIDTGGIVPGSLDKIEENIKLQAEAAIDEADLILLVMDVRAGVSNIDMEIAHLLRKTKKPVILVANKAETLDLHIQAGEFYQLGLGEPIAISAAHGMNTGDLLDAVIEQLPPLGEEEGLLEDEFLIKVAFAGRPNVGKSSLINYLLDQKRMIVTDIPGTTRDAVDSFRTIGEDKFVFIDTAGIRRKSRVFESVEYYSILRSFRAIERSDVVVVVIDSKEGVTEQDKRIAGYAHEKGKGMVIAVNKWDLIEKDDHTHKIFLENVRKELSFLTYVPVIFVSALSGQRVFAIIDRVKEVNENCKTKITTGILNNLIRDAVAVNPPPTAKGKSLKLYYATQVGEKPPAFIIFVNDPKLLHFSYKRYLENQLREAFDFTGTPIRIFFRERER